MMSPQLARIHLPRPRSTWRQDQWPAPAAQRHWFFWLFDQAAQSDDVRSTTGAEELGYESSSTLAFAEILGHFERRGSPTAAANAALKSMGQSRVTLSRACSHVASFSNDVTTLSVLRGSEAIWAYAASTARSSPWHCAGPVSAKQAFAFAKRWPHCSPSSVTSPRISNSKLLVFLPPTLRVQTVKTGDSSSGRPSSDSPRPWRPPAAVCGAVIGLPKAAGLAASTAWAGLGLFNVLAAQSGGVRGTLRSSQRPEPRRRGPFRPAQPRRASRARRAMASRVWKRLKLSGRKGAGSANKGCPRTPVPRAFERDPSRTALR